MKLSKKQITLKKTLESLINDFGYWSKEVKNFNDSLLFDDMNNINLNVKK